MGATSARSGADMDASVLRATAAASVNPRGPSSQLLGRIARCRRARGRIWSPPGAREREAASAACAARLDAPRSVGAMDITLSFEPFARAEARRGAV